MRLSQLVLVLSVFGCLSLMCGFGCNEGECSKDADCKGARICTDGECVDPQAVTEPYSVPCGVIDIACNCSTVEGVSDGDVAASELCESAWHIYEACGTCQGGYAWQTRCLCGDGNGHECDDAEAAFEPYTCTDGTCAPSQKNCSDPVLLEFCGGHLYHCPSGMYESCCEGIFAIAPPELPYYCSVEGMFTDDPATCSPQTCQYQATACP